MTDLPLTELCMICHIHPYKYCCPRCSSRTCSLTCIKRHKQWASCNGIRDPAAYLKPRELATPKGIDHDYNYLTSIERQLDNAERNADSRGILLYSDNQKKLHHPVKGEVPLENAIKQCRVVIDRAPKGMSRHKQNETHWDRRAKRIIWTVEWVHKDGSREVGKCPDTEPLSAAYARLVAPKAVEVEKPPKKKRKANKDESKSTITAPITPPQDKPSRLPATSPTVPQMLSLDHHATTPLLQSPPFREPPLLSPKLEQPSGPHIHFYLLLPSTPTSYRVLVPLSSSDTLSTALTDRLVLEFPTIYALKQSPEKLPTGFVAEEDYLKNLAENEHTDRHLDGLLNEVQGWGQRKLGRDGKQELDTGALQDVLKRDLISVVDSG
ncbi:MAG: hypothetical protein Q9182_003458 [Xanthomendoza sp. 2 TL-2023]